MGVNSGFDLGLMVSNILLFVKYDNHSSKRYKVDNIELWKMFIYYILLRFLKFLAHSMIINQWRLKIRAIFLTKALDSAVC